MSRKRVKNHQCSNCDTHLHLSDNFCPNCGQENHTHKLPVKHFVIELLESTVHFDTKIVHTLRDLFLHPGLIVKNYNENKRARYVPPVRFYIFASFVFFLTVGLVYENSSEEMTKDARASLKEELLHNDSMTVNFFHETSVPSKVLVELTEEPHLTRGKANIIFDKYKVENDPVNRALLRQLAYIATGELSIQEYVHKVFKNVSAGMFFLMPLFALLLMLFEYTQQKYYSEHLVYAIYLHCLIFFSFSAYYLITMVWKDILIPYFFKDFLSTTTIATVDSLLTFSITFGLIIYFLLSLKKVYGQSWFWTTTKAVGLSFIYIVFLMLFLFISVVYSFMM